MSKKKLSKGESIRRSKNIAELAVCACLVGAGVYAAVNVAKGVEVVKHSPYYDSQQATEVATEAPTESEADKIIFENTAVNTKDKFRGDLILVNEEHQYFSMGDEDLVSVTEKNNENGYDFFSAVDEESHGAMTVRSVVYDNMASMIADFYHNTGLTNLVIYGGYRSTEFQQELYDDDLAQTGEAESTRVAKPGFSEHESGYAFDFTLADTYDYDGTGEYAWITEHCADYGFILRYPEGKEDITKIQYEPWHFRYVGKVHAKYMTDCGITLEEYTDLLRTKYTYDGEHLQYSDGSTNYEIYFVPSDDGADTTNVPVPSGYDYAISGNNVDGFVVTVDIGVTETEFTEEAQAETPAAEDASDEQTEE